jgi:F0F1-type ATP synthase alpha subunit
MICPVFGMKNNLKEEMVVFSTGIMDMSLKLELDSVEGVLADDDKLIKKRAYKKTNKAKKKGAYEKSTENPVDGSVGKELLRSIVVASAYGSNGSSLLDSKIQRQVGLKTSGNIS